MNNKVTITIEKGNYHRSHKGGAEYTGVGFSASTYGSGCPCDSSDEVERAVQHCKDWIRREGDIPVVDNLIEKRELTEWF